jgi:hypothetical protein
MPVIPSFTQEVEIGGSQFKDSPGKRTRPYQKQTNVKRTGGLAQMGQCLPSKHDAPSSIPSPPKKKKNLPTLLLPFLPLSSLPITLLAS